MSRIIPKRPGRGVVFTPPTKAKSAGKTTKKTVHQLPALDPTTIPGRPSALNAALEAEEAKLKVRDSSASVTGNVARSLAALAEPPAFDLPEWLSVLRSIDLRDVHPSVRLMVGTLAEEVSAGVAFLALDPGISSRFDRFLNFAKDRRGLSAEELWTAFSDHLRTKSYYRAMALTEAEAAAIEAGGILAGPLRCGGSLADAARAIAKDGVEAAIDDHRNRRDGGTSPLASMTEDPKIGAFATRSFSEKDVPRAVYLYEVKIPRIRTLRLSRSESFLLFRAFPKETQLESIDHSSAWLYGDGKFDKDLEAGRAFEYQAALRLAREASPDVVRSVREHPSTELLSFYTRDLVDGRRYFKGKLVGVGPENEDVTLLTPSGERLTISMRLIDDDELSSLPRSESVPAEVRATIETSHQRGTWLKLQLDGSARMAARSVQGRVLRLEEENGWHFAVLKTGPRSQERVALDDVQSAEPAAAPPLKAPLDLDRETYARQLIEAGQPLCITLQDGTEARGLPTALKHNKDGEPVLFLGHGRSAQKLALLELDTTALRAALAKRRYPVAPDGAFEEVLDPVRLAFRSIAGHPDPIGALAFVTYIPHAPEGVVPPPITVSGRVIMTGDRFITLFNEETGRVHRIYEQRDAPNTQLLSVKLQPPPGAIEARSAFRSADRAKLLGDEAQRTGLLSQDEQLSFGRLEATATGLQLVDEAGHTTPCDPTLWTTFYCTTDPGSLEILRSLSRAPSS